jgi:hypothetical protein
MHAYNLDDLERQLTEQGWTISAQDRVIPQEIPGQVHVGGYTVTLMAATGQRYTGDGPSRADALRAAATSAGVIDPDQPPLR